MAEDELLVNFDIGDAPFKAKAAFTGGSWKARLTAKKSAQYNRDGKPKRREAPSSGANNAEVGERPAKKQRFDEYEAPQAHSRSLDPYARQGGNDRRGPVSKKPLQIVSSLFSFNPESKTAKDQKPEEESTEPTLPSNAPLDPALETFTSLGLSAQLARHLLEKLEIKAPTAIQKAAITQLVKEDTDAFLQAETGSGKTLAYLLPIVQRLMSLGSEDKIHRDSGLFAIVLAPTRELSKQISVVLEGLLRCANWLVSGTVLGGEKKKSEKARLRKGLNILIATPGRLADHLEHTEVLDVRNVRWLVLDEGDRLMELGFEQDIEKILAKLNSGAGRRTKIAGLPDKRNTILCSATMKTNVQKLGEISLKDAVHIQGERTGGADEQSGEIAKTERSFSAPAQLKQSYAVVPAKLRLVSLTAMLRRAFARKGSVMKTIVFISCADSVDFHFEVFARTAEQKEGDVKVEEDTTPEKPPPGGEKTFAAAPSLSSKENKVRVFRLHGSLPQASRTATLNTFAKCTDPAVLICTDVASRGLDLPNVDLVIEYDPPFNREEHLHRIGRTARAGKDGRAVIFLQPGTEEGYVDILKEGRNEEGSGLNRHDSADILKKGFGSAGIGAGKDWEEKTTEWQLEVERWVLENPPFLEQARRAYQSHIRAYATHIAPERHIFDMQSLHLGHLAKAFALRDKPGSIKVPGLRPSQNSMNASRADRKANARTSAKMKSSGADHELPGAVDSEEAKRIMRAKAKMQSAGASEFNLG